MDDPKKILKAFLKLAGSKAGLLPQELIDLSSKRMAICAECPLYKNETCQECGCYMPAKSLLEEMSCPLKHW